MNDIYDLVGKPTKHLAKKKTSQENKKGAFKSVEVQIIESRKISLKTGKKQSVTPFQEDKNLTNYSRKGKHQQSASTSSLSVYRPKQIQTKKSSTNSYNGKENSTSTYRRKTPPTPTVVSE